MSSSGKLVIIGILAVALVSAGASWWFRYAATHRAAKFWGPETVRLIRDAPAVDLSRLSPPGRLSPARTKFGGVDSFESKGVSNAPGLIHLRHALLEDQSFHWPPEPMLHTHQWAWILSFSSDRHDEAVSLIFSPDWKYVSRLGEDEILSSRPIADGLAKMLGELAPAGNESPR